MISYVIGYVSLYAARKRVAWQKMLRSFDALS